tara:strand:+ start:1128 stop:1439 length:312 start_codon:yes stop_codon:yes gene_type:complete
MRFRQDSWRLIETASRHNAEVPTQLGIGYSRPTTRTKTAHMPGFSLTEVGDQLFTCQPSKRTDMGKEIRSKGGPGVFLAKRTVANKKMRERLSYFKTDRSAGT